MMIDKLGLFCDINCEGVSHEEARHTLCISNHSVKFQLSQNKNESFTADLSSVELGSSTEGGVWFGLWKLDLVVPL